MNILREFRRVKQKSMPVRIISILLFSLILIINTFAWFAADRDITLGGLEGEVTSWDVSYYINNETNEILDQTVTLTIDEFYPGMPEREDKVHIYNLGTSSTNIQYELISVKVFGQEVLSQLQTDGEIVTDEDTNTTSLFSKDTTYPFNISYTYDKDYLQHKYVDDTTTPEAHAIFRYLVSWDYDVDESDVEVEDGENEDQVIAAANAAKDILDTNFGKGAYAYYNEADSDPSKAVEIKVRITSNFIHPSLEVE